MLFACFHRCAARSCRSPLGCLVDIATRLAAVPILSLARTLPFAYRALGRGASLCWLPMRVEGGGALGFGLLLGRRTSPGWRRPDGGTAPCPRPEPPGGRQGFEADPTLSARAEEERYVPKTPGRATHRHHPRTQKETCQRESQAQEPKETPNGTMREKGLHLFLVFKSEALTGEKVGRRKGGGGR